MDKLSYTSIQRHGYTYNGNFYGCPFSYYLRYIKQIQPTKVDNKYARFGTVIHDILASFYPALIVSNISNYQNPVGYFNQVLNDLLSKKWDYVLPEKTYQDALTILQNFSQNESIKYLASLRGETQFMPLHIELPLDDPFNIRIDKVMPDNGFLDYKTSHEMPSEPQIEHILQAGTYAISYHKKFGVWSPRMVYYYLRYNKSLVVPITQEVINLTSGIANQVTDNINKGMFKKNSDNCIWCDMRHVCGLGDVKLW